MPNEKEKIRSIVKRNVLLSSIKHEAEQARKKLYLGGKTNELDLSHINHTLHGFKHMMKDI